MEHSENSPSISQQEEKAQALVEDMKEQWPYMTLEGRRRIAAKYPRTFEMSGLLFNAPYQDPPNDPEDD